MPDEASAAEEPPALAGRVRSALESGDLDAIRDLLGPGARWGAPEGPGDADCRNRDQVTTWWASARAAGARAMVTEVTAGPGTLLVGLDVTGTPAAREAGGTAQRWQVLTVNGDRIIDIRGFGDRTEAAAAPACRLSAARRPPRADGQVWYIITGPPANFHRGPHPPGHRPVRQMFHPSALPSSPDATQRPFATRRYDRPPHRQMTASAVSRTGRYGVGWPGPSHKSWHACRTGTPARLAAARMQATAANSAYCHKSSVCHQATSSSRSGSVPPGGLLRPARRTGASCFAGRGRFARAGTARAVPPTAAGQPGWPRTSPARPRRRGGTPRRGTCCPAGAAAQARSPARRCQRRGRARRAGPDGRSCCPREWAASWQAYHDGRAEPPIAGRPFQRISAAARYSAATPPARHAASLPYELHDAREPPL